MRKITGIMKSENNNGAQIYILMGRSNNKSGSFIQYSIIICKIAIIAVINNEVIIKTVVVTVLITYLVELQTFSFEIKHTRYIYSLPLFVSSVSSTQLYLYRC
jgi:hypothetical protein